MKKYKRNLLLGLFAATLTTMTSCLDVLDKEPLDIISDKTVWSDPVLIESYLSECYYQTSVFVNETPTYFSEHFESFWQSEAGMGMHWINEIADEAKVNWGYNTGDAAIYKAGGLSIGGGLLEWWDHAYVIIRKLNEFLQRLPSSPIDENLKDQRMAEARFLRAFNYFAMVKRYGAVPLITVPQKLDDPEEELYAKRTSEKAVYDFILSEMTDVVEKGHLPDVADSKSGRPTKYVALALISRAALYAGSIAQFGTVQLDGLLGIPASEAQGYYRQSYNASKEIKKKFSLYNSDADKVVNFKNIFLVKDNNEVIFAKKHNSSPTSIDTGQYSGGNCWGYDFAQCPKPHAWNAGNKDAPYLEMAEEFEYIDGTPGTLNKQQIMNETWTTEELWGNKDPRFFATIYTQNTDWKGAKVDYHNGLLLPNGQILTSGSHEGVSALGTQTVDNSFGTGFGVMKYLDESSNTLQGPPGFSSTDYIVFRYGEILLNLAEAAFELNESDALGAINELRRRAGIKELETIDREKIRHERKVELAFEGHRYWDVRRWRIATDVLSKGNSGLRYIQVYGTNPPKYKLEVLYNIDGDNRPKFSEHQYYFPITLGRTGNNPNLVENPGYK